MNYKKSALVVLGIIFVLIFAGCKTKKTPAQDDSFIAEENVKSIKQKSGADIDLTVLSKTAAYAQNFNILTDGQEYESKTIKIQGNFFSNYEEQFNKRFYSCLFYDATACCQIGLNFIWLGEHSYPEDYPDEGSEIEIMGKYVHHMEGELDYYCIECDSIKQL